jgi:hypothetical protein
MIYQCTEERFLADVSKHQLTILRDDGLNKHLRFKRENGSSYWFDIITYSGRLIIDGDCGTFVFARIEDMMDFFRTKKNDWNYNKNGLSINPSYWGEKLRAVSNGGYGKGNIKKFSEDIFKARVKEYFDRHFEDEIKGDADLISEADIDNPLSSKELSDIEERTIRRNEIWESIEEDILRYPDNEYDSNKAAYDFDEQGFRFVDFHEYDCKEYTFEYIWNCYAIAMGVKMYDAYKQEQLDAKVS